ncbi:hypothetical protein SAMN05216489_06622 [Streptomyces sp. 3213]|nr:hypothetical protein SAMN05216489_06622 [Streptomyces sp. 3213] [Streptomyces sp. 3213.3]
MAFRGCLTARLRMAFRGFPMALPRAVFLVCRTALRPTVSRRLVAVTPSSLNPAAVGAS